MKVMFCFYIIQLIDINGVEIFLEEYLKYLNSIGENALQSNHLKPL